jgi:serine/threonine-protein kinase
VDGVGSVYVVDGGHERVLKLAAGSDTQTEVPFAGLGDPWAVAVDGAGNVYVADRGTAQIVKLAAA